MPSMRCYPGAVRAPGEAAAARMICEFPTRSGSKLTSRTDFCNCDAFSCSCKLASAGQERDPRTVGKDPMQGHRMFMRKTTGRRCGEWEVS